MTRSRVRRDLATILIVILVVTVAVNVIGAAVTIHNSQQQVARQHRADQRADARQAEADERARALIAQSAARLALELVAQVDYKQCTGLNGVRSQIFSFIDSATVRTVATAKVTLAPDSPATPEMKAQTFRNLVGSLTAQKSIHDALTIERCVKP